MKMQVVEVSSWPMKIVLFPINEMKKLLTYHSTYNECKHLREEVAYLRERLIGLEEVLEENRRYKTLLNFQRSLVYSSLPANVIGRDPDEWTSLIIIDRGHNEGVKVGMPVVMPLGVVGKVVETGKHVSKVMLLIDSNFSVAAVDKRSRETGVVTGTLGGRCRMRYISQDADIQVNDKIVTSKISASFPEGLLIGEVISVIKSPSSPTLECLIEPAVPLSRLEEVLVILK